MVDCIKDNGATMAAFRATCTNWRKAADSTMDWLSPKAMWPKDLLRLFSKLQVCSAVMRIAVCQWASCRATHSACWYTPGSTGRALGFEQDAC